MKRVMRQDPIDVRKAVQTGISPTMAKAKGNMLGRDARKGADPSTRAAITGTHLNTS